MMLRRRLSIPVALLASLAAPGLALAQGVLLPPGEVPLSGGQQPSNSQLFSTQPILPGPRAAPQNVAPQTGAPQVVAPQVVAPQAVAPQAPAAAVPLPMQRPASASQQAQRPSNPPPPATLGAIRAPVQSPAAPSQGNVGQAQAATIDRLTQYWNSVQTLVGTFVQVDPDGTRKTGDFYLQKPGRVRFEYNAPTPIELISNGQSVAVRDRKLNTQDITPLSQTPLRFLLAERIDLARNPDVVGVYQDNLYISVVMQEQVPMLGTYRLLILFDAKDYQLKQWIVTDPQGYDTSVAISNLNYTQRPDPKLFTINFERMLQ